MFELTSMSVQKNSKKLNDDNSANPIPVNWPDRSFIIGCVEFLTIYWDPTEIPNPVCIYIGDWVDGFQFLTLLFPTFEFHLFINYSKEIKDIDSTCILEEKIKEKFHIHAYSDFDKITKKYINQSLLITNTNIWDDKKSAINDVKTLSWADEELSKENQEQEYARKTIKNLMTLQWEKLKKLNPIHAWFYIGTDMETIRFNDEFRYISGILYRTIWQKRIDKNPIMRLKPTRNKITGKYTMSSWNKTEFDGWDQYHHKIEKYEDYINPYTNITSAIDFPNLLNDFDSSMETKIFELYLRRILPIPTMNIIYIKIKELSIILTDMLNSSKSNFPGQINKKEKIDIYKIRTTTKNIMEDPFAKKINPIQPNFGKKITDFNINKNQKKKNNPTNENGDSLSKLNPVNPTFISSISTRSINSENGMADLIIDVTEKEIEKYNKIQNVLYKINQSSKNPTKMV